MKDIRSIPITVLKALEPFLKTKSELFHLKKDDNVFLNFVGLNNLSDCYFKVLEYQMEAGKFMVTIAQKPQNEQVVDERIYKASIDAINPHLERWKSYLTERKRLEELFTSNERIVEIEEEFFKSSHFYDYEFDNEYFSISEATQLSNVCTSLIEYVESTETIKNKEEIVEEINFLEINSTQESKRKLAQRFAKIKALMVKNGPKVLNAISDIGVNVAGNVIAKMITG